WAVQLEDAPKAWIRLRVDDGTVHLDAGRTERAEGIPAPIVRYEWSARPDNPAPLIPVAGGEPIDQQPLVSEQLELRVPAADGEYYVTLRVFDALGRVDQSTGVFRVTAGEAAEVDLQREHPAWVDRAVVYGVVPFFFGPTGFRDVLERLEQIAALGVTAIWLSPVTAAPEGDFGYALADPFRVRAEFGTEAEFHALVQRAQALGLRVIMDFVPNHVSDRHRYYLDVARRGSRSPYYGWFERGADGEIASYFDWDNLKNLDYDNPEVQNYVIAAFAYWVRRHGVDGFRVDAGWGVRQRAPEFWQRWREELRQCRRRLLQRRAGRIRQAAAAGVRIEPLDPPPAILAARAQPLPAAQRLPVGGQLGGNRLAAFRKAPAQQPQLVELLHRERQPGLQHGIQRRFGCRVHRHVQQGARRRQPQPLAETRRQRLQPVEQGAEIGPPDVAAVDHAQRQHLVAGKPVQHRFQLFRRAHDIDVQAVHRQAGGQVQVVAQAVEIGRQQPLEAGELQAVVGMLESLLPAPVELGHQDRFVELYPLDRKGVVQGAGRGRR